MCVVVTTPSVTAEALALARGSAGVPETALFSAMSVSSEASGALKPDAESQYTSFVTPAVTVPPKR